ncbi:MAG TPA: nuclease-related domain-containing protein [Candidatus Dojkabacteria bacterium]|nr:nuclease-related domain-containing protein [Candidatus Dojkabacteria bacterium]
MDKIIDMFFSSWDSYDSYERGDQGEIVVANKLLEVEHSYSYQNIMLPNSKMDIDHIVLSRKGIFVIETKNYTGRIEVYGDKWYRTEKRKFGISGKRKQLLRSPNTQALSNAMRLRKFLLDKLPEDTHDKLFVKPLVVMVNDFNPDDIHTKDIILDLSSLHNEIYSKDFKVDKQLLVQVKKELDKFSINNS